MFKYYYGPDTYGAREEIGEMATKEGARIKWLDRGELETLSLSERAAQGSRGLFGKDLLLVRDPSAMPKGIQEDVARAIHDNMGTGVAWDRTSKRNVSLAKAAGKGARQFSALNEVALTSWLEQESAGLGMQFAPGAAQVLIQRLGSDRWRLRGEVARLSLRYQVVDKDIVAKAVPEAAVQHQIFGVLDALVSGRGGQAIRMVQEMLEAGENEFFILAMLAYQFRSLYLVASGNTQDLHSYVVDKRRRVAASRPAKAWAEGLTRITATDFAVKQGRTEPQVALAMLMIGLAGR